MVPHMTHPYHVKPGHRIYCLGKWRVVEKIIEVGRQNTTIKAKDDPVPIVLNNQEKFQVQIPGMLT